MEPIGVALIAGPLSAMITLVLARALGYHRDSAEIDALVSDKWREWAADLERRVERLEAELAEERKANLGLQAQNQRQEAQMAALVRWALQLREEVVRLGGRVPKPPAAVEPILPADQT